MPTVEIAPNIEHMIIQLIALLILFAVFKRFGWEPTKEFLKKRQEIIASQFAEAQVAKEESLELKKQYEQQIGQAKDEADRIIEESREQGKIAYENIVLDARNEASQKIAKAEEAIELDVKNAREKIKEDIIDIAVNSTEKIIKKEIDVKEHQELFDDFIAKVGTEHV